MNQKKLYFIVPNLLTGKWEIMNPPFGIFAYCKSGLEDGKNGKKFYGLPFFPSFAGNQSAARFLPHPPHFCEIQQLLVLKPKKRENMLQAGEHES